LRCRSRRRVNGQALLVPGAVVRHGLRAADVAREPARHRGLPAHLWIAAV
jgi:hypothetical protein